MPQIFRPRDNTLAPLVLLGTPLLLAAVVALALWLPFSPWVTRQGLTIEQPVPFSHEHHVSGLGLDCRFCHSGVERSAVAGLPPTETCMTCHSQIWTNAEMLAPVRRSMAEGRPIPWVRVHRLPDYAYFDHGVHVARGVGCSSCHGDVGQMRLMRQAAPLTMGWCLDCHRDPAPALRPPSAVFDPAWRPPADQRARGSALLAHQGIDPARLSDCSICHR